MMSRRMVVYALAVACSFASVAAADAFEFEPYQAAVVQKAIQSGAPVVVHVFAPWCLQCQAQRSILSGLAGDKNLDRIKFFRVSYDDQKDVVGALKCPRSTLIAYKGGKEVARMSWGTTQDDVVKVLQAAY